MSINPDPLASFSAMLRAALGDLLIAGGAEDRLAKSSSESG